MPPSTRRDPTRWPLPHTHSLYGKAWSTLGRQLDPLNPGRLRVLPDHALFDDFSGVVLDTSEVRAWHRPWARTRPSS